MWSARPGWKQILDLNLLPSVLDTLLRSYEISLAKHLSCVLIHLDCSYFIGDWA